MAIKILVVDDEPDFASLIKQQFRKQLKSKKYELIFAMNGVEALETLDSNDTIDIILTDLNMPVMGGLEFLKNLKKIDRLITTVVVSAYGDMKNIRAAMNMGSFDFITKPIDFEILEGVIDKTFEHNRLIIETDTTKKQLIQLETEMKIAKQMQELILPNDLSLSFEENNIEIYGEIIQSENVMGDCFDLVPKGNNQLQISVSDIAGKNIHGALLISIVKTFMHFISLNQDSPHRIMFETNQFMNKTNATNLFVTSFLGSIDTETGLLTYCNAGQKPPVIIHKDGSIEEIRGSISPALGMIKEEAFSIQDFFKEEQYQLQSGDLMILYTDGVVESFDDTGKMYGIEHLKEDLINHIDKPSEEMVHKILENIHDFRDYQPASDDMTLLTIRYAGK